MNKKYYNKNVLTDIYEQAVHNYNLISQWNDVDKSNTAGFMRATEHMLKCESLVEVLESAIVFHVGLGINLRGLPCLKKRLDSIGKYLKGV